MQESISPGRGMKKGCIGVRGYRSVGENRSNNRCPSLSSIIVGSDLETLCTEMRNEKE
jgi:hypothetical protein